MRKLTKASSVGPNSANPIVRHFGARQEELLAEMKSAAQKKGISLLILMLTDVLLGRKSASACG